MTPCPAVSRPCPGHTLRGRVPVSLPIDTGHGHASQAHHKQQQACPRDSPAVIEPDQTTHPTCAEERSDS